MSDQQPLLNPFGQASFNNDDNRRDPSTVILFNWRRWLSGKNDDSTKPNDKNTEVGTLHMFRFADRVDFLLIFIAAIMIVIYIFCLLIDLMLEGELAGLFTIKSFNDGCESESPNLINTTICPLDGLCQHNNETSSPTTKFRKEVMNMVHWLFIIGVGEVLTPWAGIVIWIMSFRRQTTKMNIRLFQSLLQRNIAYFDKTPTSQFNPGLFTSIETIEAGMGFEFMTLVSTLLCLIVIVIACFALEWRLSLILLCLLSIVVLISFVLCKIIVYETKNDLKAYAKAGQIVAEVFSSFRTVLSFNGTKYEQKRYENELSRIQWSSVRKGFLFGVLMGWLSFMTYIAYPIIFSFGSLIMSYENNDRLAIDHILVIVSIFAPCMTLFGNQFQSYSEARAAAAPIFQLIDEAQNSTINEPDVWRNDDALNLESIYDINHDIEFDNVNFLYASRNDVSVLCNLSFIARAGQTTALVGSSGCGKSTCLSLLLRHYEVSSGQIKIGDRSITNYNLRQLRQNIGVVSQEPILFNISIYENIRFGKVNATRSEIEQAARQANAHDFIMLLPKKYETFVGERGVQLSGGEKQRIALARALVKQPSILLLDEATSALDTVSEKIVQEALDRACKNRTTIVIAHRLTTIQNAHHIYVLEKGTVVEEGTHETLMNKEEGKYQTMVKRQQIERMDDDKDNLINMEQLIEEDQRIRLLTDTGSVDGNKENLASTKQKSIFLRLLSMSSPEWRIILIGCIICVMNGALQTGFAILVVNIVGSFNYCMHPDTHPHVLRASFFFFLLTLLLLVLRVIEYTTFAISGSKLIQRIRLKTFGCLLHQEIGYFDRPENSSSAIGVRLASEASAVEQMVGTRLGVFCETFALACFGLTFGMLFNWQLTMIVFLAFIFIGAICYLNIRLNVYFRGQSGSLLQRANTFAVDILHNIRTVKQLSVEKEVLRQYSEMINQVFKMSWKQVFISVLTPCAIWGVDAFVLAFLYWRTLVLFEQNQLTSDDIIMVFAFATFTTQSIKIVGVLSERVGTSLSAAQSFFDLFDRTPTIDNTSTSGQQLVDFRGQIEFNQVKFAYPSRRGLNILKNFHLTVKAGQRVALVGKSGCGKSTIIQLLERFYDVTNGRLLLDGIDIRQLDIQWVRSRLGLVSQEPVLFDLTIAENITYGLENVPLESIINAATSANIHQFIEQLPQGYETKVGMKGGFLSGGEKQRIAIARVLIRRPKVLLLDEATSALDSYSERIVQQVLEQAQVEDPTRTSLIIAHRLSTIRSCDLICVLDNGRIIESGTHEELIQRHGTYYRMLTQHNA